METERVIVELKNEVRRGPSEIRLQNGEARALLERLSNQENLIATLLDRLQATGGLRDLVLPLRSTGSD